MKFGPLITGHGSTQNIIYVQQISANRMRLYCKERGKIIQSEKEFFPFFYLTDSALLKGFGEKFWQKKLEGNGEYQYLCVFDDWNSMWQGVRTIYKNLKIEKVPATTFADVPDIYIKTDPVTQFLLQSGETFFKGLEFNDLSRMQFDIETYSAKGFSRPARPSDRIIIIVLSDNLGWEKTISGEKLSEKEMLMELMNTINERDPDVLEGHNILSFDLPYISSRCKYNEIEFRIGRDGSIPLIESVDSTFSWESRFDYVTIVGRQVVDTLPLVIQHDSVKRDMDEYGLKYSAKHFNVAAEDRIYIEGEKISWYWDNDPEILIEYAKDDVAEVKGLSDILFPSYFYQAQMLPLDFDQLIRVGVSTKIELLMVREYLREKHSLPQSKVGGQTTGGYTNLFYTGVYEKIIHADVESLYPSIILNQKLSPESDRLNLFLQLLKELTEQRIKLKHLMQAELDPKLRQKYDSVQSTFKIFINSFYGYLGFFKAIFNDYHKADMVTSSGQKILKEIIDKFLEDNCQVIEVDTDGLYFSPPENVSDEQAEKDLVNKINLGLPEGINLTFGGRFSRMMSYKKKNYALLTYDNRLIVKGSSLISRAIEKYSRNFIKFCIESIITNNLDDIPKVYMNLRSDIIKHALPIMDLCKSETLRDNFAGYIKAVEAGKRTKSASYELAIKYYGNKFEPGDRITYFITGTDPNIRIYENCELVEYYNPKSPTENVSYYLKKLDEYISRFEIFFSKTHFQNLFPSEEQLQFQVDKISVLNKRAEYED